MIPSDRAPESGGRGGRKERFVTPGLWPKSRLYSVQGCYVLCYAEKKLGCTGNGSLRVLRLAAIMTNLLVRQPALWRPALSGFIFHHSTCRTLFGRGGLLCPVCPTLPTLQGFWIVALAEREISRYSSISILFFLLGDILSEMHEPKPKGEGGRAGTRRRFRRD